MTLNVLAEHRPALVYEQETRRDGAVVVGGQQKVGGNVGLCFKPTSF